MNPLTNWSEVSKEMSSSGHSSEIQKNNTNRNGKTKSEKTSNTSCSFETPFTSVVNNNNGNNTQQTSMNSSSNSKSAFPFQFSKTAPNFGSSESDATNPLTILAQQILQQQQLQLQQQPQQSQQKQLQFQQFQTHQFLPPAHSAPVHNYPPPPPPPQPKFKVNSNSPPLFHNESPNEQGQRHGHISSQNQSQSQNQNPESTMNGEGLIAFVPRVDRHQPDFDLIHSQEGDVARLDIKNRKFPKLIFSITDYETATTSGFSTSLSSRKGVAILRKRRPSEHQNLYCEVVISGYDLEEKKSDHWVWSGSSYERFPCKMSSTIFNFKEDASGTHFMKRQFEIQIHCHVRRTEYFWRGKLVFSPSNSRGDWGIAIDPVSTHLDLKYQGIIGINDPLNFYHPQIYIKEGVGLVTDTPPSKETANSLISLSGGKSNQTKEVIHTGYKWSLYPPEGPTGCQITIEAEGFASEPAFRNDYYEVQFREHDEEGNLLIVGKSTVKPRSPCKIVLTAPEAKPGTTQVSVLDVSRGKLVDQILTFTFTGDRLSLNYLVNPKKKKVDG